MFIKPDKPKEENLLIPRLFFKKEQWWDNNKLVLWIWNIVFQDSFF